MSGEERKGLPWGSRVRERAFGMLVCLVTIISSTMPFSFEDFTISAAECGVSKV
jgi:hypothetical protein